MRTWDAPSAGELLIGAHRGYVVEYTRTMTQPSSPMTDHMTHHTIAHSMGENIVSLASSTVFRENTVLSMNQAADYGAAFIEFDVQVTRDGMPVIWHDDHVLTGDATSPTKHMISELTLAQFKKILAAAQSSSGSPPQLLRAFKDGHGGRTSLQPWLVQREDELPTLAEVFAGVPVSVGFDIEVKMTTPDTVERTPGAEVRRVVDPILAVVAQCAADRHVVFSSFDPEVCVALREGQTRFPVLFLSGGGAYAHVDPRRTSVHAAIEFAAEARLQGVVFETGALRANENGVAAARAQGLTLYTYGQGNNDAAWLARQQLLGVTGAIVDDVPGVMDALVQMRATQQTLAALELAASGVEDGGVDEVGDVVADDEDVLLPTEPLRSLSGVYVSPPIRASTLA